MLRSFEIREIQRTGRVALPRLGARRGPASATADVPPERHAADIA